jgi:hypothetical protein
MNIRRSASFLNGIREGFLRVHLTHPNHIATTRLTTSQHRMFVADQAGRLAATAVNAEEYGHERSSTIGP